MINIKEFEKLITIARLAIAYKKSVFECMAAKELYHEKRMQYLLGYEIGDVIAIKLSGNDDFKEYTKKEYKTFIDMRNKSYRAKAKLFKAIGFTGGSLSDEQ